MVHPKKTWMCFHLQLLHLLEPKNQRQVLGSRQSSSCSTRKRIMLGSCTPLWRYQVSMKLQGPRGVPKHFCAPKHFCGLVPNLCMRCIVFFFFFFLQTFKEEIERSDQPGGPLLDGTDIKLIFGKIPPIYDTHMKIRDDLNDIINNWREDRSVGDVILRHVRGKSSEGCCCVRPCWKHYQNVCFYQHL